MLILGLEYIQIKYQDLCAITTVHFIPITSDIILCCMIEQNSVCAQSVYTLKGTVNNDEFISV